MGCYYDSLEMANRLPKKEEKKKVTICPYFITEKLTPYYSTTDEDSASKRCIFQMKRLKYPSHPIKPKSQGVSIRNQKFAPRSALSPRLKKVEKKVVRECKMQHYTPPCKKASCGKIIEFEKEVKNRCKASYSLMPAFEGIKWDTSIENMNGNQNVKFQERNEQRFQKTAKKLQSPCIRKIRTEMSYDDSCLSRTTRNVLDNKSSTNEMLWVNPQYLDKKNTDIKIPDETEDKASHIEVPIAAYIRGQKQLKMKRNRRHGEKYFYDKELNYRRIVHDKSFSLNLHNHPSGYDDDMGDPHTMQKELTAEEKKALGSYPDPPYKTDAFINPRLLPRVIASETTPRKTSVMEKDVSTKVQPAKINASRSDDLVCQLGIYIGSELSDQSTPRDDFDAHSERKQESDSSFITVSYADNEDSDSARSNNSLIVPPEDNKSETMTYIRNKEYSSSRTTMEDYMEFRNILALSREDENEQINADEMSPENNSTECENNISSAEEETEDNLSVAEALKEYEHEPAENKCDPSIFFPSMIPDPSFALKIDGELQTDETEAATNTENTENNNESSEIKLEPTKVENHQCFLDYQSPNTEEFYAELGKWCKMVNCDLFRRNLRGPGLKRYWDFGTSVKNPENPSPKSDTAIFQELYKKYSAKKDDSKMTKGSESNIPQDIVSSASESVVSCTSDIVIGPRNSASVDCIYKSPENAHRFPLQVIAEEESVCEVDFGQPFLAKNWMYNFLLKPSSTAVESVTSSNDENQETECAPNSNNFDGQDSQDQENSITGTSKSEPRFIADSQVSKSSDAETEDEQYWIEPTIDWENMPPFMIYNIMQLSGGFLTDIYARESHENFSNTKNHFQHKGKEAFTTAFEPANLKMASIFQIEEVNSAEEEAEEVTPSSSQVTVIENKIRTTENLPEKENIQIPTTLAKENILENATTEMNKRLASAHAHNPNTSRRRRRKLPIRIAFGLYSKLRNMKASLSRMMGGMKNYFRVKGVIRKISPSSFSLTIGNRNKNHISVIKRPPTSFNTYSAVKLNQENTKLVKKNSTHNSL